LPPTTVVVSPARLAQLTQRDLLFMDGGKLRGRCGPVVVLGRRGYQRWVPNRASTGRVSGGSRRGREGYAGCVGRGYWERRRRRSGWWSRSVSRHRDAEESRVIDGSGGSISSSHRYELVHSWGSGVFRAVVEGLRSSHKATPTLVKGRVCGEVGKGAGLSRCVGGGAGGLKGVEGGDESNMGMGLAESV
jgi:hypothetical protein